MTAGPGKWSRFSPEEIERRRALSIEAMKHRDAEAFASWHQEECDRTYWAKGQCCAGCDHWQSDAGWSGKCTAAGIVSGAGVLRSLGIVSCSYVPPPGFPYTEAEFHCGKFSDAFDWSTLPAEYLEKIGAMKGGRLMEKPRHEIDGNERA